MPAAPAGIRIGSGATMAGAMTGPPPSRWKSAARWNRSSLTSLRRPGSSAVLRGGECERLQGFPEDFTRISSRGHPAVDCPNGPRYKALGNCWAVNCAEWIGERIALVEVSG